MPVITESYRSGPRNCGENIICSTVLGFLYGILALSGCYDLDSVLDEKYNELSQENKLTVGREALGIIDTILKNFYEDLYKPFHEIFTKGININDIKNIFKAIPDKISSREDLIDNKYVLNYLHYNEFQYLVVPTTLPFFWSLIRQLRYISNKPYSLFYFLNFFPTLSAGYGCMIMPQGVNQLYNILGGDRINSFHLIDLGCGWKKLGGTNRQIQYLFKKKTYVDPEPSSYDSSKLVKNYDGLVRKPALDYLKENGIGKGPTIFKFEWCEPPSKEDLGLIYLSRGNIYDYEYHITEEQESMVSDILNIHSGESETIHNLVNSIIVNKNKNNKNKYWSMDALIEIAVQVKIAIDLGENPEVWILLTGNAQVMALQPEWYALLKKIPYYTLDSMIVRSNVDDDDISLFRLDKHVCEHLIPKVKKTYKEKLLAL